MEQQSALAAEIASCELNLFSETTRCRCAAHINSGKAATGKGGEAAAEGDCERMAVERKRSPAVRSWRRTATCVTKLQRRRSCSQTRWGRWKCGNREIDAVCRITSSTICRRSRWSCRRSAPGLLTRGRGRRPKSGSCSGRSRTGLRRRVIRVALKVFDVFLGALSEATVALQRRNRATRISIKEMAEKAGTWWACSGG